MQEVRRRQSRFAGIEEVKVNEAEVEEVEEVERMEEVMLKLSSASLNSEESSVKRHYRRLRATVGI